MQLKFHKNRPKIVASRDPDRQTDRQIDRQTDRHTHTHTERHKRTDSACPGLNIQSY